ncbi:hypothetical protein GUF49_00905, partial [Xanthomonas citri pv. citri]|nr:hypothetical protein [Xanthomonas citri pv. citri]
MIKNLPFVGTGSSFAQIGLTNLNITLSYEVESRLNFCPKVNSTNFEMTLDQLSMNFEDLNPGQDSGDLINGELNSITD